MRLFFRSKSLFTLLGITVVFTACDRSAVDSQPIVPSPYVLEAEPAGAEGVIQWRERITESEGPTELVLIGRVGGLGQPTWDPERAAFMMSDLSFKEDPAEHDDGAPKHDVESCPFCRKKRDEQRAALVMIEIVAEDGNVPPVDARELLGLSEGQTVVLRGDGKIDGLGMFVVRTGGVYVQP